MKKYGFEAEIKIIKKFYSGPEKSEDNEKGQGDHEELRKMLDNIIDQG